MFENPHGLIEGICISTHEERASTNGDLRQSLQSMILIYIKFVYFAYGLGILNIVLCFHCLTKYGKFF